MAKKPPAKGKSVPPWLKKEEKAEGEMPTKGKKVPPPKRGKKVPPKRK